MRNLRQGNLVIPEPELGGWDFTSFNMPLQFKDKLSDLSEAIKHFT